MLVKKIHSQHCAVKKTHTQVDTCSPNPCCSRVRWNRFWEGPVVRNREPKGSPSRATHIKASRTENPATESFTVQSLGWRVEGASPLSQGSQADGLALTAGRRRR